MGVVALGAGVPVFTRVCAVPAGAALCTECLLVLVARRGFSPASLVLLPSLLPPLLRSFVSLALRRAARPLTRAVQWRIGAVACSVQPYDGTDRWTASAWSDTPALVMAHY